jgi:NDP-sugar pyrophosphorylase family protein
MNEEDLYPHSFFDLTNFAHAALADKAHFVWELLDQIAPYLKAYPLGNIEVPIPATCELVNPELISIGAGTVVEAGSYIKGPTIIGRDCQVRQGAYIRGNVIAGDRCVIGHCTELKNSILLDGAQAAHFNYVGDSILGNGVNLGAGTRCANLRFDGLPIPIVGNGKKVESGRRKLGAILGDGAQTGCNCVTNPGTLLVKGAVCPPCACVKGFISLKNRQTCK